MQINDVIVVQMPLFNRKYKKLHVQEKKEVDSAIRSIVENPNIGQEKKGDLSGIFVYKFKLNIQEMLLAYEWNEKTRTLVALGVHENFYRDLKR